MSKVFFANSGSEANDSAIKLIWYYNNALGRTSKKKIIGRHGGYHGVTIASGSVTGLQRNHSDFDLPLPMMRHTACPALLALRPGRRERGAIRDAHGGGVGEVHPLEGPDTVAGFFAEPVMGSGGVIVPPRTISRRSRRCLRKYDVLFVADEVICGFGRLGDMFGTTTYNLKPDLISIAKACHRAICRSPRS